jgi:predicted nucleotidyltransferase component of viral defense system
VPRFDGSAVPGVLLDEERLVVQAQFGVGPEQVVRDHVISHVLAAISEVSIDDVLFFGGTALSRTHLPELRLSEDIDLIALDDRTLVGQRIEESIVRRLRRTFGVVSFTPALGRTRHSEPTVLDIAGIRIQIQLLSAEGYPRWPTEVVELEQRYSDAPPARLRVYSSAGFVASKLAAWNDRATPRDLYDLWALARAGLIDREAVRLFGRLGPYTNAERVSFSHLPSPEDWERALSHQGLVRVGPSTAAALVRSALAQF